MDWWLVGLGGALGSMARFGLGQLALRRGGVLARPGMNFAINASGALLLGMIHGFGMVPEASRLLADGLIGSYTTFSALMMDGIDLRNQGRRALAWGYGAATVGFGLAAFGAGYMLGRWVLR